MRAASLLTHILTRRGGYYRYYFGAGQQKRPRPTTPTAAVRGGGGWSRDTHYTAHSSLTPYSDRDSRRRLLKSSIHAASSPFAARERPRSVGDRVPDRAAQGAFPQPLLGDSFAGGWKGQGSCMVMISLPGMPLKPRARQAVTSSTDTFSASFVETVVELRPFSSCVPMLAISCSPSCDSPVT